MPIIFPQNAPASYALDRSKHQGQQPLSSISDAGTAAAANVGTGTGQLVGTDEINEYYGLEFQPSVNPTIESDFEHNTHRLYEQYGNQSKTILQVWDAVRPTPSTYADPFGKARLAGVNEPLIDYSTGKARLMSRDEMTNSYSYSGDFSNDYWFKRTNATVTVKQDPTNPLSDIHGGNVYQINSLNGDATYTSRLISLESGKTYTVSRYVHYKTGDEQYGFFITNGLFPVFSGAVTYQLIDNELVSTLPSVAKSINLGGGWYRIYITDTAITTATAVIQHNVFAYPLSEDNSNIGAMFNEGGLTSYIPTEAGAVTRAADTVSRVLGDEFNPSEGSIYWEGVLPPANGATQTLYMLADTNSIQLLGLQLRSDGQVQFRQINTVSGAQDKTITVDLSAYAGQSAKLLMTYTSSGLKGYALGAFIGETTINGPADLDAEYIGNRKGLFITSQLYTKLVARSPKALPHEECIELTKV